MPTAVIMPKFEMAQETGTVGRWLVEEGAAVAKGDPILEVETDKVTMDVEAPAGGILRGITAAPGQVIPIGQTIAYILQPDEPLPGGPSSRKTVLQEDRPPGSPTPVAARVAAAHNLDLAGVPGTGPAGRITRTDVEAHLACTTCRGRPTSPARSRGATPKSDPQAHRRPRRPPPGPRTRHRSRHRHRHRPRRPHPIRRHPPRRPKTGRGNYRRLTLLPKRRQSPSRAPSPSPRSAAPRPSA